MCLAMCSLFVLQWLRVNSIWNVVRVVWEPLWRADQWPRPAQKWGMRLKPIEILILVFLCWIMLMCSCGLVIYIQYKSKKWSDTYTVPKGLDEQDGEGDGCTVQITPTPEGSHPISGYRAQRIGQHEVFIENFFTPHHLLFFLIWGNKLIKVVSNERKTHYICVFCCRTSSEMPDVLSRRKQKQSPSDQDLPWCHHMISLTFIILLPCSSSSFLPSVIQEMLSKYVGFTVFP